MRNNQLKCAKIVLYIRTHKIYKRKVILISLIKQIKLLLIRKSRILMPNNISILNLNMLFQ